PEAGLVASGAYLAVLTGAAWWADRNRLTRRPPVVAPVTRFAVLIPAHDEERLIGRTLDALAAADYPTERLAVHVVADNCTDRTAAIGRQHGVEVHERVAPDDGGKGPALRWLLQRLRDRGDGFDAVVIVDADTTVSPGFFRAMDTELGAGAEAVQSY